jgi:hypothetical protein
VREFEKENERLKQIITRQALELEVKSELLKNAVPKKVKLLVISKYKEKASITQLTEWTRVSNSSWYNKSTKVKRGIPPSTHMAKRDRTVVKNEVVLDEIKMVLSCGLDF